MFMLPTPNVFECEDVVACPVDAQADLVGAFDHVDVIGDLILVLPRVGVGHPAAEPEVAVDAELERLRHRRVGVDADVAGVEELGAMPVGDDPAVGDAQGVDGGRPEHPVVPDAVLVRPVVLGQRVGARGEQVRLVVGERRPVLRAEVAPEHRHVGVVLVVEPRDHLLVVPFAARAPSQLAAFVLGLRQLCRDRQRRRAVAGGTDPPAARSGSRQFGR